MNQAPYVCLTTPTQSTLFWVLFASLSSGWGTAVGKLLAPSLVRYENRFVLSRVLNCILLLIYINQALRVWFIRINKWFIRYDDWKH